jgi:glycosyltransferase involved in cell wall biosynthesis
MRVFAGIIAVNRREAAMLGGPPRVHVIPCGVDRRMFMPMPRREARALLGLPQDAPMILWAGEYWQPEKRIDLVNAVVGRVKRTCPEAELVVVSGQPHAVVPRYMNACDVLLLCSSSEGSPMVVKEAVACGLPVVSTDAGDVREILEGIEGCAVVAADPEVIAGALVPLLMRPRRVDGHAAAVRYDAQVVAQRVIGVYESVSHRRGRAATGREKTSGMDQGGGEAHLADRGSSGRTG